MKQPPLAALLAGMVVVAAASGQSQPTIASAMDREISLIETNGGGCRSHAGR